MTPELQSPDSTKGDRMESVIKSVNLKESLAHFGLCPIDWSIEVYENNLALVKNIQEDTFQFIGKINPKAATWEYLQLHSL